MEQSDVLRNDSAAKFRYWSAC